MKKLIVLLLLFSVIATPSYALNLLEKIIYREVRIGNEQVLVNKFTGKVEQKSAGGRYQPISNVKGWGGIPSEQDMYQAQYNRINSR